MIRSEYSKFHRSTGNVAVVVPLDSGIIELSFFQSCLMGVCESADIHDYEVMLCYSDYRDLRHLSALVEQHKIDGVVVTRTNDPDLTVNYLLTHGVPFVTVGCHPDGSVIQIDHNHEEACKELTLMSVMKGRKRIAFIGNQEQSVVTQRRFKGYCEALRSASLKIDPRIIHQDIESRVQTERVIEEMLELDVDSIICTDEAISYWVYISLKNRNISVPTQVELSSCYHSNALEDYVPAITTIKYDSRQLGATAADTLFALLNGKEVAKKQLLSYELNIKKDLKQIR